MVAQLFAFAVSVIILGFLWFYVVRPILEAWEIIGPREGAGSVNTSQARDSADAVSMSSQASEIRQTTQTDGQTDQTDRASAADEWLDRLEVDRTRGTWVELMVYIGYSASEIRGLLKGDNGALGGEVEAARRRLGMESAVTPIAGRPTVGEFRERPEHA